ncbi:MAG: sel1 repeat family protein, partial [Proteobacteria bacterium]|nr:sel1 repeat family protein [Pseudomonadota bacterium]
MGDASSLTREESAARLSGPPEERAAFLRQLAGEGVAEAQALLGQLLLDGNGVARDER